MRYMTLLSLLLAGCGGTQVSKITGSVLTDGDPADNCCVTFFPATDYHLGSIFAKKTEADGTFETLPDSKFDLGRIGTYKVMITDNRFKGFSAAFNPNVFTKVDAMYWNPKTTPLEVTLTNGENDVGLLEIHRGKPRPMPKSARTNVANLANDFADPDVPDNGAVTKRSR